MAFAIPEREPLLPESSRAHSIYPLQPDQRAYLNRVLAGPVDFAPTPREMELRLPDARETVMFLNRTGIHPSELANPARYHMEILNGTVLHLARNKTGAEAFIPLHNDIRAWAKRYLDSLPIVQGSIVQQESKVTGELLAKQDLGYLVYTRQVARFGKQIGLDGLVPRTLRHTAIADLFDATSDIWYVSAVHGTSVDVLLDYAKPKMLNRYPAVEAGHW